MALNLDERYPGRANPKTLAYPQGSFKNRASPSSNDGTYLEQDWANDWGGFFQSLLKEAGIAANGVVDTAQASQYYDALIAAIRSQDASESQKGVVEIATAAEAQGLSDDQRALTPKKLADAFSGANRSVTGDNRYQIFPGTGGTRRVVMNIKTTLSVGSILAPGQVADVNFDFPIAVKAGTIPGIVATTRNVGLVIGLNGSARWPGGDTIAARNITENNMGPGVISDIHIVVVGDI